MKIQRGEKKLVAVCALALAIPLGVAAFIGHINKTPIVAATPPAKAPNPNGYDLCVRAANTITPANPPVDANLDTKIITDPKIRAQRYSLARKDAWLAQNKAGFALFEQAQKADSLAPPSSNNGKELRQMARYKITESNAHWQRGNYDAALQSGLDIAQLGYDIQRGGAFVDMIVGNAISGLASRATGDTVELVSAPAARNGARRLEQLLATRWTLDKALIEDKARVQQDWLNYFATSDWRADFVRHDQSLSATWGTESLTWKQRCLTHVTSKHKILSDLNLTYERAIFNARLPYGIEGKPQIPLGNPFIDKTYAYRTRRFSSTRALTSDYILLLRLALRAYQLEHGAPPPNLQALVPAYLNAVPADPFGKGEPLRYRASGKTHVLWSIGPDGKDDGGTPIPWRNKKANRKIYADERERLPFVNHDSMGDYVAGKNH